MRNYVFKMQMKIDSTDSNSGRIISNDWYFIITKGEFTKKSNNFSRRYFVNKISQNVKEKWIQLMEEIDKPIIIVEEVKEI